MRGFPSLMIASLNRGKQSEFHDLFQRQSIQVVAPDAYVRNAPQILDQIESHEKTVTYADNAKIKCLAAFKAAKIPTFADDSGLEVDGLGGKPGVASALTNSKKILEQLKGNKNRKARFRCVLYFAIEGVHLQAEGICEGHIAEEARGKNGFGFDDIFIPDQGGGKTFAEMTKEEKNAFSHRKLAVDHLLDLCKEREIQFVRP